MAHPGWRRPCSLSPARRGRRQQASAPGHSGRVGVAAGSCRCPRSTGLLLAGLAVVGYCGFVALGHRLAWPSNRPSRVREAGWLAGSARGGRSPSRSRFPTGAPDEYDLTKWAYVNYFGASTGYYQVARKQAAGRPLAFLAEYPVWIQSQDSLHIGTHPPGLDRAPVRAAGRWSETRARRDPDSRRCRSRRPRVSGSSRDRPDVDSPGRSRRALPREPDHPSGLRRDRGAAVSAGPLGAARLRGLGSGGALAAGPRGEPVPARRGYGLSLALDLGPGPGGLGGAMGLSDRGRCPGTVLALVCRAGPGPRHLLHAGVLAGRTDRRPRDRLRTLRWSPRGRPA